MFPLIKEYTRSSIVGGPPLVLVDDTEDTQQLHVTERRGANGTTAKTVADTRAAAQATACVRARCQYLENLKTRGNCRSSARCRDRARAAARDCSRRKRSCRRT
jgi:hypothetical protein